MLTNRFHFVALRTEYARRSINSKTVTVCNEQDLADQYRIYLKSVYAFNSHTSTILEDMTVAKPFQ